MMVDEWEPKLDPRQKRTRRLIQDAFFDLLKEKTFDSITVQDIAERATVNRTTFYDHFDDKFALMEYCFRDEFQQMLWRNQLDSAPCTIENLGHLITVTCEFVLAFWGKCSHTTKNIESRFETQIITLLDEILLHWLEQAPAQETSRELRASVASWAIFGAALHWKKAHKRMSLDEYVRQVMPMITDCLGAPSLRSKAS